MKKEESLVEAINTISSLDKEGVKTVSEKIIAEYESGNVNPEEFIVRLEFMLQSIEDAMFQIRQMEMDNLLRMHGDREARAGIKTSTGAMLKVKEAGIKYDYSQTERWQVYDQSIKAIEREKKSLEEQLKAITKPTTLLDEQTGELTTLHPAIRTSKTTLEISIPKSSKK